MSDYYFKTEKLTVGYNKHPIVENINIGINKGEILTLIGPNGAGKSTILKSMAGQLNTLCGAVYLDEKDMGQLSSKELSRKLSVVFTQKLRTEMMTCEDVVATGRYPYTGRFGRLSQKDWDIVREAMELILVYDIRKCDFSKISDGQRQRVMLARAVCQQPEVIILDEPTSYLDIKYKLEFFNCLQVMKKKKNLTVIMSLHELDFAEKISDKILCVNGKYVERYGKPEDIFEKDYIRKLFDIQSGSFDEKTGSVQLQKPQGNVDTFVIAGAGTGKNVFYSLQKQGIPFFTGVISENDIDYQMAQALSEKCIKSEAYEPVTESAIKEAKELIKKCSRIICTKNHFGTYDTAGKELLEYAKANNKDIEITDKI